MRRANGLIFWRTLVANIKSQIKRNRQNNKRRLRNRVNRGAARTAIRDAHVAIDAGVPESKAALMQAISLLDRAASKGVIHKNNAARRKSRLMKAYGKMVPTAVEAETAMTEPVAEAPKKATPRKRTVKVEEPEAEPAAETMTEPKKKPVKKAAAKKATATTKKTTAKKE
jgi:small subunit ribosomal protein S20